MQSTQHSKAVPGPGGAIASGQRPDPVRQALVHARWRARWLATGLSGLIRLSPGLVFVLFWAHPGFATAQNADPGSSVKSLKQLSLEELLEIEVTSVSKLPEKLSVAASAQSVGQFAVGIAASSYFTPGFE